MIDRRSAPRPAAASSYRFPPVAERRLDNGLRLLWARHDRGPLAYLGLLAPAGVSREPATRPGLAMLTGALLGEGTSQRSAFDIALAIEGLGGSFATGADWDTGYLSIFLRSQHLEAGFAVLTELATDPTFPPAELERLRREALSAQLRQRDQPATLAELQLNRALYGEGLYGLPAEGTEEGLRRLQREHVAEFFHRGYRPDRSTLVVAGGVDGERLAALAGAIPTTAEGRPWPERPVDPRPRRGVTVWIVDRPGATQTELRVGHAGIARMDPDFVPLTVLNVLLGGKFTSRLNLNLRERHGFTYGASSQFRTRRGPGPFVVSVAAATETCGAAAREILAELGRLRREPVGIDELADTRSYLTGVFPYTLQTVNGLARRLESIALYGLPLDYFERYPEAIRQVTREDLLAVAERHLEPETAAVVAVGPAAELAPQLEELGPVQVTAPEQLFRRATAGASDAPAPGSGR
jgi:zinc protease